MNFLVDWHEVTSVPTQSDSTAPPSGLGNNRS